MIPVTSEMKPGRASIFIVVECKREMVEDFRRKIQICAPYVQLIFRKLKFFRRGRPNEGIGHFARSLIFRPRLGHKVVIHPGRLKSHHIYCKAAGKFG